VVVHDGESAHDILIILGPGRFHQLIPHQVAYRFGPVGVSLAGDHHIKFPDEPGIGGEAESYCLVWFNIDGSHLVPRQERFL
jgi:hypothetical protein